MLQCCHIVAALHHWLQPFTVWYAGVYQQYMHELDGGIGSGSLL